MSTELEWLRLATCPASVLLADDDLLFVDFVKRVAADYNVSMKVVESGGVAIEQLRNEKFDLVILDLVMPGIDGIDVLRFIRGASIEVPVVIFSGKLTTDIIQEVSEIGLVAFVAKPSVSSPDAIMNLFRILGIKKKAKMNSGSPFPK